MMLNLTPIEIFFLYENLTNTVVNGSEQQELKTMILSKIKSSIVEKLESLQAETSKSLYEVWKSKEAQKLKDLSQKNEVLKTVNITSLSKPKTTLKKVPKKKGGR
jgi:hypothetical protein